MAHRRKRKLAEKARRAQEEASRRRRQRLVRLGAGGAFAAVIAAASLLLIPYAAQPVMEGPNVGPNPGQIAPAFVIRDVDGNAFDLQAQRGNVVLLDFMGSRCPACVLEMPHLVETYETFRGRNFAMISIDVGGSLGTEDPQVARAFLRTYGGSWRIALDNQGLGVAYQTRGALPTLVIVDATGIVNVHNRGPMSSDDMIRVVQALL